MASDGAANEARRATLLAARATLTAAELSTAAKFDRAMLVISSLALVLSVALAHEYAPEPVGRSNILLVIAWLDYLGSISTILCAFQCNRMAARHEVRMLDRELAEPCAARAETAWTTSTLVLNWVSLGTFCGGTLFLLCFAIVNIRG